MRYGVSMSIRQRLYLGPSTIFVLAKHCFDARFAYIPGLEQRNLFQCDRVQKITTATQMRALAQARKTFDWLAEIFRSNKPLCVI